MIKFMLKMKDTRILLALAIPLIASGLVEASLGFTSTIFLSHLGAKILAIGSLVAWFFATLMIILWGLFSAVSVSVSNRHGAKDELGIAYVIRDGFWLAIGLTIPTTILIWNMSPILHALGQSEELVSIATPYLHALSWSILPDFLGLLLIQLVIGLGHARTNLVFIISWVILNITADYVLIFGHLGFPAMGIVGLGWGTSFSFWVTTVAWFAYLLCRQQYRPYFKHLFSFSAPYYYKELITVGLPAGVMWCIEVVFFFAMFLIIGHMGVQYLAAAQVAMQYIGLFVAVLFSIAQAVTVRMSNRLGANDLDAGKNAVHSGLLIALSLMSLLAVCAWVFPDYLIAVDFNPHLLRNAIVTYYAKIFLSIGVGFLLLEAVRITLFGALRGLKDTRSTLIGSLLSFWLIAFPLGYAFSYYTNMGSIGMWLGLLMSGFFGVGFLCWRYSVKLALLNQLKNYY